MRRVLRFFQAHALDIFTRLRESSKMRRFLHILRRLDTTLVLAAVMATNIAGCLFSFNRPVPASIFLATSVAAIAWLFWETFRHTCNPRENELIELLKHKYPLIYKEIRALRRKHPRARITFIHEIVADLRAVYPLRDETLTRLVWTFVRYVYLVVHFSSITFLMKQVGFDLEFKGLPRCAHYWKHLYYHVVTVATVGYGDMYPEGADPLSYWVIVAEILLTVVFILNIVNFFQGAARLTIDNFNQAIRAYFSEQETEGG